MTRICFIKTYKTTLPKMYVCEKVKEGHLGKPAIEQLNIAQLSFPSTVTCGEINQHTQYLFIVT